MNDTHKDTSARRVLLVQGRSQSTYWGFQQGLERVGLRAAHVPLGLITVAAALPSSWKLRLVDLNVGPLCDRDLCWADEVFVGGMLCQAPSMREVLARARALGKRTTAGGPAATSAPEELDEADHIFPGEAEGRLDRLVAMVENPDAPAPRVLADQPDGARPDITTSPVPRFDLLDLPAYGSMSLQYSRGCPFGCEFCDVVALFGRRTRTKRPEQVLAELDALASLGYRGSVFVVDDNFIGNRKATAELLPAISAWQRRRGRPFELYTEASIDLAERPDLISAMVDAGFSAVFVGIETPSEEALREARKHHNLRRSLAESVLTLVRAGLEVHAGFIVGFDSDGPDIFARQRRFIESLPIPLAMVGMLTALPGTALHARLAREGRIRVRAGGDQFARPNFVSAMDERVLLRGYRELLAALYAPDAYFARCRRALDELGTAGGGRRMLRNHALRIFARACAALGVASPRTRRHYWPLLARAARRDRSAVARAVSMAIMGEHLIRYTHESVLPALDAEIAALDASPVARPSRASQSAARRA